MPLGIGAGLLAGAGQGFVDLQRQAEEKRRQELQQLYVLQTLKSLQGQSEASQFGGFGFTPPDLSQSSPVGGSGETLRSPSMREVGPQSNYTPGKGRGFSIAMQHTPEEQDRVAATIASQDGAQHWANFNPTLSRDLQAAGLPTSGPVPLDRMQQFLSLVHKDESMGGQNIPNYRFDPTHTAGGVDQITNTTWNKFAPRAGVNASRMGPVDTSPQARAEGAKEIGATPAQFSPQQGPDTYNRAVQEVIRSRQQAIQEIIRRTPNATPQQRKPFLDEWDRQAKEWLGGIKEQNARAAEQGRYERGRADEERRFERGQAAEEGRFERGQAAEQRRHERNIEERAKTPTPGAGREKDIEKEISRLDQKFKAENPKATQDELDAAHFKNRRTAESGLAESKAAPARTISSAIARRFLETHPDATDEDLITLYGKTRREAAIQTAFAGGEPARQLRSLNTLAGHIGLLREYGEALRNGNVVRANQLLNAWSLETGHPEVTDFNEARTIAADEIIKLLTNTGGTESDRQGMQAIWSPNASPEQLAGASNVATRFIKSRLDGLQQQYARNDPTKRQEFTDTMLSPEAKSFYSAQIPGAAEPQRSPEGGGAPQPGAVQDGYRFKGGDPGDPNSWERVQ